MGRLVNSSGRIAQCIAQASEAEIPKASQLIRKRIERKFKDLIHNNATLLQKILLWKRILPIGWAGLSKFAQGN
jgi:hypothetical protein